MGREISEPQRAWLAGELDAWSRLGVVTESQVKEVLGLYASPRENRARQQSRGHVVLLALAAVSVGLGVLLLVGYNWEALPAAVKVGLVFAGVVATHGLGLWFRFGLGQHGVSEVAFFFGCLLYGVGIWLLAQVFHISGHNPDGFWWWALGTLPFALLLDTLFVHALLVALLAVWAGYEVFGYADLGAWFFGRLPAVPNGAYSLLPMAAPGLVWAYRKRSPRAVALYVPLLAWWVILQPFAWRLEVNPVFFIGAIGGLLLLLAEAHREGSAMAIPFRFYGAVLIAGILLPLSYMRFNSDFGPQEGALKGLYQTLAILVLAVVVLAEVVFARRRSRPPGAPTTLGEELLELARRQWLPCALIALMEGLALWNAVRGTPLIPTVLANVAMLAFAIWLMQIGLHDDRGTPFAAGVIYFLLWAVLRYIDLFGAFGGMLGGALMFFLCGATLLGVAWFWRQRKAVNVA